MGGIKKYLDQRSNQTIVADNNISSLTTSFVSSKFRIIVIIFDISKYFETKIYYERVQYVLGEVVTN